MGSHIQNGIAYKDMCDSHAPKQNQCIIQTCRREHPNRATNKVSALLDLLPKVLAEGSTVRLEKARGRLHLLCNAGVHANTMDGYERLQTFDSTVLVTAMYGIHITDTDQTLFEALSELEKQKMLFTM